MLGTNFIASIKDEVHRQRMSAVLSANVMPADLRHESPDVFALQIESSLMECRGTQADNFDRVLPSGDSDMVSRLFKDSYLFNFLGAEEKNGTHQFKLYAQKTGGET